MGHLSSKRPWLIVGGGVHGSHLAIMLIAQGVAQASEITILDPRPHIMSKWQEMTNRVEMSHLRSPGAHHIAPDPQALSRKFRKSRNRHITKGLFALPNRRPSLMIFNSFCQSCIADYDLQMCHLQAKALRIRRQGNGFKVSYSGGGDGIWQKVILAIGSTDDTLNYPVWAKENIRKYGNLKHIFEPNVAIDWLSTPEHMLIVGGGISAAQLAVSRASKGFPTTMLKRGPLRIHQFDSSPCWMGSQCISKLQQLTPAQKRKVINEGRNSGSVPPGIAANLRRLDRNGNLKIVDSQVDSVDPGATSIEVKLESGDGLKVKSILLASGYSGIRPGGQLIDFLIQDEKLPISPCGYPILDQELQWCPGLFVTGGLAELEIGPLSRNILGARLAAKRILRKETNVVFP